MKILLEIQQHTEQAEESLNLSDQKLFFLLLRVNKEKRTELEGLMEQYQMGRYIHYGSPRRKREKGQRSYV